MNIETTSSTDAFKFPPPKKGEKEKEKPAKKAAPKKAPKKK